MIERVTAPDDLQAVAALEAACFSNPWTRSMLEAELRRSDVARLYAVKQEHKVVAFCFCWLILDELHINTIAVDHAVRRRGLASALMRFVMAEAAREGALRATLEVRRSNHAARRLYQTLGFEETAVRKRYYTQPEEDALILWRGRLDPGSS